MEIDTAHGDRVVVSANTALHVDGAQDWAQPGDRNVTPIEMGILLHNSDEGNVQLQA